MAAAAVRSRGPANKYVWLADCEMVSEMGHPWQPERPLVYGYLCVEEPDETQIAAWSREIAAFCTASGYRLGSIFIDRGISIGSFARGGFVELLAALRLPESFGVVVPSLAQLSTETFVQQALGVCCTDR